MNVSIILFIARDLMHIELISSKNQLYYKSMQQKAAIPCRRLVDFCYKLLVQCSCKAQSTYEKIEFFYGLRCLAAILHVDY